MRWGPGTLNLPNPNRRTGRPDGPKMLGNKQFSTFAAVPHTQQKNRKTIRQTKNANIHQHHAPNHPNPNMQQNTNTKKHSFACRNTTHNFWKIPVFLQLAPFSCNQSCALLVFSRTQHLWITHSKQPFSDLFQNTFLKKGAIGVVPSVCWLVFRRNRRTSCQNRYRWRRCPFTPLQTQIVFCRFSQRKPIGDRKIRNLSQTLQSQKSCKKNCFVVSDPHLIAIVDFGVFRLLSDRPKRFHSDMDNGWYIWLCQSVFNQLPSTKDARLGDQSFAITIAIAASIARSGPLPSHTKLLRKQLPKIFWNFERIPAL